MTQELQMCNETVEWLCYDEAAEVLQISRSAFNRLINRHPQVKEKYVEKFKKNSPKPKFHIRVEGLLVLANVKDSKGGNAKSYTIVQNKLAKQKLAEKSFETPTDLKAIITQLEVLSNKVAELEQNKPKLIGEKGFPTYLSEKKAPPVSPRTATRMLVSEFVEETGYTYQDVWNRLYKEMYYRCNVNIMLKAKNRGARPIDVIEELGLMEDLHSIASEILT